MNIFRLNINTDGSNFCMNYIIQLSSIFIMKLWREVPTSYDYDWRISMFRMFTSESQQISTYIKNVQVI